MDLFEIFEIPDSETDIYETFVRLSCDELKRLEINMTENQYKIYKLVKLQKCGNFGDLSKFNKLSYMGLQPILDSFPNVLEGIAFIETFKPGFRYSREFKNYLQNSVLKTKTEKLAFGETTTYKLDNHVIIVDTRTGLGSTTIRTRFYVDGKLHRIGGPADFTLENKNGHVKMLREYYYENGINTNLL
jgi:hypothetical protein